MAWWRRFGSVLAVLGGLSAVPATAEDIPVDLQLVLAVDSSGSVNADEFRLQMHGFAQAFRHPTVLQAIQRGPIGAIAITLFEWSSQGQQHVTVPWTMISDEESMATVADIIDNSPRFVIGGSTSVSDALRFALATFQKSGFASERLVIDVSGDGSNNNGPAPDQIRDQLVERGITINGLAILTDEPNLKEYYARSVIGGTGSFVMAADSFETFANSILSKLISEIAAVPSSRMFAAVQDSP